MTAYLQIERPDRGLRDRYRAYEVIVNGEKQAELWRGDKKRIEVEPGPTQIHVKIDWCRSRTVDLALKPGDETQLICRPRPLVTVIYGVTFGRNNYVRLEEVRE
jgi:hypothetical protein